ncbi:acyltransferase family protein [Donghicola sp. XS_ASV15]|uniref:acyltransferase family protein n=1 Tax=Donghicola sp. XS_ASV15 TaxID=3241295 RepID=UPI0035157C5E
MSFSHRHDIDGLRAIAVLPVVFGHAGITGFSGGFVGVDVFFVISGYLITAVILTQLDNGTFSLSDFYLRRVRRLLPALFFVIAATSCLCWVLMPPADFEAFGRSSLSVLTLWSNIWLWQNTGDYFGAAAEITPLLHTWSLAVEEQFYLVFPAFLIAVARFPAKWRFRLIASATIIAAAFSIFATFEHPTASFYLMPTRVWEFGGGALIAAAPNYSPTRRWAAAVVSSGLVMIVLSVITYDSTVPTPGVNALLPVAGAMLVIYGGQQANVVSGLLASRSFVYIGLLSYSLYLWHWPVQVAFRLVSGVYHLPLSLGAASIILSFLLAALTYALVEQPMRSKTSAMKTYGVLSGGLVALGGLSAVVILGAGLPQRMNSAAFSVYSAATERPHIHQACMDRALAEGPCRLGRQTGAPSLLVWGDSHAGAALPAFQAWTTAHGTAAVAAARSGCPPVIGVNRADRALTHGCAAANSAVIAFLREHSEIQKVVLAARWPLVFSGERSVGEAGGRQRFVSTVGAPVEMSQAFAATVSHLRMMGKEVLILGPVPEMGLDLPRAYFARTRLGLDLRTLELPDDPSSRLGKAEVILRQIASKHGAYFQPLFDAKPEQINLLLTHMPLLYADDDHLSEEGALRVVLPPFAVAMRQVKSGAPIRIISLAE